MSNELNLLPSLDITILVRGEVSVEGALRVHNGGSVLGRVRGRSVLVEGVVDGFISGRRVEITSTGIVKGRIEADSLIIRPGGQFKGICRVGSMETLGRGDPDTVVASAELKPETSSANWFWKKSQ